MSIWPNTYSIKNFYFAFENLFVEGFSELKRDLIFKYTFTTLITFLLFMNKALLVNNSPWKNRMNAK